jgi:hypothetical protein
VNRVQAFSLSRLVLIVLLVAVLAAMTVNFVIWLDELKGGTAERIDSHARQLEVLAS